MATVVTVAVGWQDKALAQLDILFFAKGCEQG